MPEFSALSSVFLRPRMKHLTERVLIEEWLTVDISLELSGRSLNLRLLLTCSLLRHLKYNRQSRSLSRGQMRTMLPNVVTFENAQTQPFEDILKHSRDELLCLWRKRKQQWRDVYVSPCQSVTRTWLALETSAIKFNAKAYKTFHKSRGFQCEKLSRAKDKIQQEQQLNPTTIRICAREVEPWGWNLAILCIYWYPKSSWLVSSDF